MKTQIIPDFVPGNIVIAYVFNPLENRASRGKARPFILVERQGSKWLGIGLTTNSYFEDGTPRVTVPNWREVGLFGPGFLWGDELTGVCVLDIDKVIGQVDADLGETILRTVELTESQVAALERCRGKLPQQTPIREELTADSRV